MSYQKTIVCLANSRKTGGRCIAGKEKLNGLWGEWIRPVSYGKNQEEVSEKERKYENGKEPELLDIISIEFIRHNKDAIQPENHLIDSRVYWKKLDKKEYKDLTDLKDAPRNLWINENSGVDEKSSARGHNNRIKITDSLLPLSSSLYLIYLETLAIKSLPDRSVRAVFQYNKEKYDLNVTDPLVGKCFLKKKNDLYNNVYLCVSIGKKFKDGYHYKFVASIIKEEPF